MSAAGTAIARDLGRVDEVSREFNYANRCRVFRGKFWADSYPPEQRIYAQIAHDRNNRVMALAREVSPRRRLLDLGCGFGDLLYGLRDDFQELHGADPSAEMVAHASENLAARGVRTAYRVVRALAEDLPYEKGYFDAVVTTDTYEHIHVDQRARALAEIRRVLRPGGRLVLVTPSHRIIHAWALVDNVLTIPRQVRAGKGVMILGTTPKAYTEVFCTRRGLTRDIRAAGLTVERFERVSFYPAPERPGFLEPYLKGLFQRPRIYRAMEAAFRVARAVPILRQKMLVACIKPAEG